MRVATAVGRTASEDTDAEIIGRMRENPAAFEVLFERHFGLIYGFVNKRLGPDLAEDLAAETFLIAFDRWRAYDTNYQSARPWLVGIAANLVAGHERAEARWYRALAREAGKGDPGNDWSDPLAERVAVRLDAEAVRGRLATALHDITATDREVLLLVAWGGLSCEEAARALDIPAGTARSRLHRARKKVRVALGGADPTALEEEN